MPIRINKVTKEGAYFTFFVRFIGGTLADLKNMSLKEAIEKNNLSKDQWQNARVAMSQSALFVILLCFAAMTKGWKDKDDRSLRLLAYSIRRLELETGAMVPWPPTFINNVFTLIQSPAAGVKTLETAAQVFDLANLAFWSDNSFVKSGRFKGWWKPAKAAYVLSPVYNITRLVDMDDYNYMFNIYICLAQNAIDAGCQIQNKQQNIDRLFLSCVQKYQDMAKKKSNPKEILAGICLAVVIIGIIVAFILFNTDNEKSAGHIMCAVFICGVILMISVATKNKGD